MTRSTPPSLLVLPTGGSPRAQLEIHRGPSLCGSAGNCVGGWQICACGYQFLGGSGRKGVDSGVQWALFAPMIAPSRWPY